MHEERAIHKGEINRQESVKTATAFRVNRNEDQSTSIIDQSGCLQIKLKIEKSLGMPFWTLRAILLILEDTAASLQAQGKSVKLSLSTMTSERTIVQSRNITGLLVHGFQSKDRLKINNAYTRNFTPVDRSHIPKRETASMWPHLKEITERVAPLQSCYFGLLLGYNCPQALAPLKTDQGIKHNLTRYLQILEGV